MQLSWLLLLCMLSFVSCQVKTCDTFKDCGICIDNSYCAWCNYGSTCYNNTAMYGCRDTIKSKDACPAKDNYATDLIAVMVPLYIVLTVIMIIIHYLRVHAIEPIIDFHVNRRGNMDFSALLDSKIESMINTTLSPSEELLWADVALNISRWRHMVPSFLSFLFGSILMAILATSSSATAARVLTLFFILLLLPCLLLIYRGLYQLIKKRHYTDIYLLTNNGAIIVHHGLRGGIQVNQWPYHVMTNVHSEHVMYKVASVFFAKKKDRVYGFHNEHRVPRPYECTSFTNWRDSHIGFENIVKADEVEQLIRQRANH